MGGLGGWGYGLYDEGYLYMVAGWVVGELRTLPSPPSTPYPPPAPFSYFQSPAFHLDPSPRLASPYQSSIHGAIKIRQTHLFLFPLVCIKTLVCVCVCVTPLLIGYGPVQLRLKVSCLVSVCLPACLL